MKKLIVVTAILSTVLISCNETKNNQKSTETSEASIEKHNDAKENLENTAVLNNDWVHEIVLNDGDKWEANIESTQGVANMLDLLNNTKTESLEDYRSLGMKLNDENNTLIKECTMTGPAHDNLHVFLHPLIEKIDYLMKASSSEEAATMVVLIRENLEAYESYFQ